MKKYLVYIWILFFSFDCQSNSNITQINQTSIFSFSQDKELFLVLNNRTNIIVDCDDKSRLPEFIEIKSIELLQEIEKSWQFKKISDMDSIYFFLGEETADFILLVKKKEKIVSHIGVYITKQKILGIYHSELGKLKQSNSNDVCKFLKPFLQ